MTTYSTDSEGKFIPASQRPDGTWRKARRVRDGYVPQEEVPLYKSKGKEFAQRKSTLPPGMCPVAAEAARKEREKQQRAKAKKEAAALAAANALTAAIEAPAKAVGKQKQTAAAVATTATGNVQQSAKSKTKSNADLMSNNINAASACASIANSNVQAVNALTNGLAANLTLNDDETALAKQLKKLRKKLREIESIKERLQSGELKKPEKDQLQKVKRRAEILKEIKALELLQLDENDAAAATTTTTTTPTGLLSTALSTSADTSDDW